MLRLALINLALSAMALCAHAGEKVAPDVAIVARLYRDFAWEVVVAEPRADEPGFIDQPARVLSKYLAPQLVRLLLADRACAAKREEICNLDFDPIWASQDPAATELKVRPGNKAGTVKVTFLYPGTAKPMDLLFELTQTPSGPRIRDVHYSDGRSLVTILRRKP